MDLPDFLVGGFFPNVGQSRRLPRQELSAALSPPNLVYYHWEVTGERLKELPQLSQLVLLLTQHQQLDGQSVAAKWLDRIGPALGHAPGSRANFSRPHCPRLINDYRDENFKDAIDLLQTIVSVDVGYEQAADYLDKATAKEKLVEQY